MKVSKKSIGFILVFILSIFSGLNAQDMNNMQGMSHSHMMMPSKKDDVTKAKEGKEIYETMCNKIQLQVFSSQDQAKRFIKANKLCQDLDNQQIETVSFYLMNPALANENPNAIKIPDGEKCATCGMLVNQRFVAKITTNEKEYYFDGVNDMLEFYFDKSKYNKAKVNEILLTDFFTLDAINAKDAYFVVGSNAKGPMGKDIFPFKDEASAKLLVKNQKGKIVKFDELNQSMLRK